MTEPSPRHNPGQSSIRSFVAVPLPGAVQTEIAEGARALGIPGVKWVKKPENLHVTMKFLGPVAADRLEVLGAAVGAALADVPRFELVVRGFGAFPSAEHAKVVFAGINDAGRKLAAVAEVVEIVSARLGFAREERAFTAHVTVGRSERRDGVDARTALGSCGDRVLGTIGVDEVHVYESRLSTTAGEGSTYVLRGRAPLGSN